MADYGGFYTRHGAGWPLVLPPYGSEQRGTVVFLHGACDTGPGVSEWIAQRLGRPLRFDHLKVVLPTASPRRYTPSGGGKATVWFDFPCGIRPDAAEDLIGLESRLVEINAVIRAEIQRGIPPERILLGGISQGGILSLHVGLRFPEPLAGIFALSAYLPENSPLFGELGDKDATYRRRLPVYMAHGNADRLIPMDWGRRTGETLNRLDIPTTFKTYNGLGHDMCKDELEDLRAWILDRIPS